VAKTTNDTRKREPRGQDTRKKRPEREDDRRRSPATEQRDRDEDAPGSPMIGGDDDER
jgi:hypothetical protein